jgi:hypothetical protein
MRHNWFDGMAIGASVLCLAHCLALPLLLLALPALSMLLGANENLHLIILLFAVPSSIYALYSGLSVHQQVRPLIMGAIGLILLSLGVWFEHNPQIATFVTICGSLFLAYAHIANWRLRHTVSSRIR